MDNLNYDAQLSDEDGYRNRYSYMENDEDLDEEELNND